MGSARVAVACVLAGCGFQHGALLVQQTTSSASTGSPLNATFETPVHAGDLLVMIGGSVHAPLDSVTGGGVTSWIRAESSTSHANIEIWFGVTDGSSGTIAIALANNPSDIRMNVQDWAGIDANGGVDNHTSGADTNGNAYAGGIMTTHAHDLVLFGAGDHDSGAYGTPTQGPWTSLDPIAVDDITQGAWYRVVTTTGTLRASGVG